jgi:hypothetical protein
MLILAAVTGGIGALALENRIMTQTALFSEQVTDPADPYRRLEQTYPMLSHEQVECVSAFGSIERLPRHTSLYRRDDRAVDFFLVHEGSIEVYDGPGAAPSVLIVLHPASSLVSSTCSTTAGSWSPPGWPRTAWWRGSPGPSSDGCSWPNPTSPRP